MPSRAVVIASMQTVVKVVQSWSFWSSHPVITQQGPVEYHADRPTVCPYVRSMLRATDENDHIITWLVRGGASSSLETDCHDSIAAVGHVTLLD